MRTTLTLDEDVAAAVEQLRRARGGQLKTVINDLLREGLRQTQTVQKRRARFRTQSVNLGRPLLSNIDSTADVLAVIEGEAFK